MKENKQDLAVFAAIAMTLHEIRESETHDNLEMRLTIRRAETPSAWSLKTNLLRETPNLRF